MEGHLPYISERGGQQFGRGTGGQILPKSTSDRWVSEGYGSRAPRSKSTPLGRPLAANTFDDGDYDDTVYERGGRYSSSLQDHQSRIRGQKGVPKTKEEREEEEHDRHYVPPPKVKHNFASVYGVGGGGVNKAAAGKGRRRSGPDHGREGGGSKRMSEYDRELFSQTTLEKLPWMGKDSKGKRSGGDTIQGRNGGTVVAGGKKSNRSTKRAGGSGGMKMGSMTRGYDVEEDAVLMDRARREQEEEWLAFKRLQSHNDENIYQQFRTDDDDGHVYQRLMQNRFAHENLVNGIRGAAGEGGSSGFNSADTSPVPRSRFDLLRVETSNSHRSTPNSRGGFSSSSRGGPSSLPTSAANTPQAPGAKARSGLAGGGSESPSVDKDSGCGRGRSPQGKREWGGEMPSPDKKLGRTAVPLLEREEEEEAWDEEREQEHVLEALVTEWIIQEFETILSTNRFHMKDLYEFLAERDVPFSRPVVKALVTKVYRQVFVLREWVMDLSDAQRKPLSNGRAASSTLIQAAVDRLEARGLKDHDPASVAGILRLMHPYMARVWGASAPRAAGPGADKMHTNKAASGGSRGPSPSPSGAGGGSRGPSPSIKEMLGPLTKAERAIWEDHMKMISSVAATPASSDGGGGRGGGRAQGGSGRASRVDVEEEEEEGEVDAASDDADGYGTAANAGEKGGGRGLKVKGAGGGGGKGAWHDEGVKWEDRLQGAALSVTLSISNRDDAEGISTVTKRGMPLTALQASWLLPPSARDGGGGTGEAAVVGCMFAAPGFRTDAHQQAMPSLRLCGQLKRALAVAGSSKVQVAVLSSHPSSVGALPIDCVTPRMTRLGVPELLSGLTAKQKKGPAQPGTVCVKQVVCDKGALSIVLLSQADMDEATCKPVAKIVAVVVCASAAQARMVQEALRNLPASRPENGGQAAHSVSVPQGLFGPNLFPEGRAEGQGSPLRGLDGSLNVSGREDFDNMSDFGDDVTRGAKSADIVRVLVHANPSPGSDTEPVLIFEGSFEGSPGTIALACRTGAVTMESLLADREMGAMHYKSHKGDLMVPLRDCRDLRPVELEEGAPIKVWVEKLRAGPDGCDDFEDEGDVGRAGDGWEDCGAWDGLLGVREKSFLSPVRTSKGHPLFSVMWGLAFNRDKCLHHLVYLCLHRITDVCG